MDWTSFFRSATDLAEVMHWGQASLYTFECDTIKVNASNVQDIVDCSKAQAARPAPCCICRAP